MEELFTALAGADLSIVNVIIFGAITLLLIRLVYGPLQKLMDSQGETLKATQERATRLENSHAKMEGKVEVYEQDRERIIKLEDKVDALLKKTHDQELEIERRKTYAETVEENADLIKMEFGTAVQQIDGSIKELRESHERQQAFQNELLRLYEAEREDSRRMITLLGKIYNTLSPNGPDADAIDPAADGKGELKDAA